jgi:hypothetical protein
VPSRSAWASLTLDRVGLLLPRLARAEPSEEWELADALTDLRLGVSIIELRQLSPRVRDTAGPQIDSILANLSSHFRALSLGRSDPLPVAAVDRFDATLKAILQLTQPADRYAGIVAGTSLRRGLFPQAPAYRASEAKA